MSHYPLHRNNRRAIRVINGIILAAASPMLFVFAFGELVKNDVWAFLFTSAAGLLWLLGGLWSAVSAAISRP
jgi:hypothetical protein